MTSPSPRAMTSRSTSFDDATENFADWVRLHATQVAIGIGAVVVLAGGVYVWRSSVASKAHRAETAFFDAQTPLAQGNIPAAQQQLQQIATRYDGTAGGTQAELLLAQTYFDQGKYQDGLNILAKANPPKSMEVAVRRLTGVGYEGMGRYPDAAKLYEQLVGDAPGQNEKYQLQADAARAYQYAGDRTSALRLWKQLAQVEGNGIADEARVRVGELSVQPAR